MALLKCKMCGGDLEIADGISIAECEYCGTKQTVPKAINENLQTLFNRANTLRIKSEFDKAEKIYEKIIQADSKQAEAYWGLILCKYGIEYVDDPATFKKVPTCHRASYDSIIADDDYKSAIENADMTQRGIYEEQAKEIDRIQKDILALAQKEETYDVFLCYKETDANGQRTQDSVIANDIYYQLKQEGLKVFYAAITLEGKLGSAYEPIIFAALNSAKVMLVIGTKPEYFNAVWVKNEWSRYLKIIKKDRSKLLIPCYRDMDAYELPEEFAHLQAQDMAKIGFINDIVRGIKKVAKKDEPKQTVVKETVVTTSPVNANISPLLKRAFMFLEDGDFESADEYCEKVLDQDPENAQAYLGKLMAELEVNKPENLKNCARPFDDNNYYHKVLRFGDAKLRETLQEYVEYIKARNEEARLSSIYNNAVKNMLSTDATEITYKLAAQNFASIKWYKDSDELAEQCLEKAEMARKDSIYSKAIAMMANASRIRDYEVAKQRFQSIPGWKDSDEKAIDCQNNIDALIAREEAERLRKEQEYARNMKRLKKICIIVISVVLVVVAFIILLYTVIIPHKEYNDTVLKYNNAVTLMDAKQYDDAIDIFEELDGFKDSKAQIEKCNKAILDEKYDKAIAFIEAGEYEKGYNILTVLGQYRDADAIMKQSKYELGIAYIEAGEYTKGYNLLTEVGNYLDAKNIANQSKYERGIAYLDNNQYGLGYALLEPIASYINSDSNRQENIYSHVSNLMRDGHYDKASKLAALLYTFISFKASNDLAFTTNGDGTCYVSGIGTCSDKAIRIPMISPDGDIVVGIDDLAFCGISTITSVHIPYGVEYIGEYAFGACSNITSIEIPNTVTTIWPQAFQYCSNLKSITLPEGLGRISLSLLYGCSNLESIVIPSSVTIIEEMALCNCRKLTSITFNGTTAQWHSIYKDSSWNDNASVTKIICSDGEIALN